MTYAVTSYSNTIKIGIVYFIYTPGIPETYYYLDKFICFGCIYGCHVVWKFI